MLVQSFPLFWKINICARTSRTVKLLWNCQHPYPDWPWLAPDLQYAYMTQVMFSVIGLLIYWPVAVFIGHAKTQQRFDLKQKQ